MGKLRLKMGKLRLKRASGRPKWRLKTEFLEQNVRQGQERMVKVKGLWHDVACWGGYRRGLEYLESS